MSFRKSLSWKMCALLLLGACAPGSSSDGVATRTPREALSAQTVTVQMTLPSTLSNAAFLVAQSKVQIDSRVTITGAVWSGGTVSMQPDATVQTVTSTGDVLLSDRDTIATVTSGGNISKGNNDVLGTVGVQPAWMDWSCHPAATLVETVMQSLSGRRRHGRHCSRGVSRGCAEGPGNG